MLNTHPADVPLVNPDATEEVPGWAPRASEEPGTSTGECGSRPVRIYADGASKCYGGCAWDLCCTRSSLRLVDA